VLSNVTPWSHGGTVTGSSSLPAALCNSQVRRDDRGHAEGAYLPAPRPRHAAGPGVGDLRGSCAPTAGQGQILDPRRPARSTKVSSKRADTRHAGVRPGALRHLKAGRIEMETPQAAIHQPRTTSTRRRLRRPQGNHHGRHPARPRPRAPTRPVAPPSADVNPAYAHSRDSPPSCTGSAQSR